MISHFVIEGYRVSTATRVVVELHKVFHLELSEVPGAIRWDTSGEDAVLDIRPQGNTARIVATQVGHSGIDIIHRNHVIFSFLVVVKEAHATELNTKVEAVEKS